MYTDFRTIILLLIMYTRQAVANLEFACGYTIKHDLMTRAYRTNKNDKICTYTICF